MISTSATPDLDRIERLCADCGGTDFLYLRHHIGRFVATKAEFLSTWDRARGRRLLDIGAHWLHQAALWAGDDFDVTALDLPLTFDMPNVQRVADRLGIRLLPNRNLEEPNALAALPESSIDVILFTEVIEHLTFNPVAMWKAIYRVLKPGGRVLVTTPNYYSMYGRFWDPLRTLRGFGGGLDVYSILSMRTMACHWKEFSRREVTYYFAVLSPDWITVKAKYCDDHRPRQARRVDPARGIARVIPILRPNLHVEIELVDKRAGITLEPHW